MTKEQLIELRETFRKAYQALPDLKKLVPLYEEIERAYQLLDKQIEAMS